MISAVSVQTKSPTPNTQFVQEMIDLQFASIEAKLSALAASRNSAGEVEFGNLCAAIQANAAKNANYASVLSGWRTHSPDSIWPEVVANLVWEAEANRARGSDWLEVTEEAQLQRAALAQEGLFLSACALLQRYPDPDAPWPLWMTLMRSVLAYN